MILQLLLCNLLRAQGAHMQRVKSYRELTSLMSIPLRGEVLIFPQACKKHVESSRVLRKTAKECDRSIPRLCFHRVSFFECSAPKYSVQKCVLLLQILRASTKVLGSGLCDEIRKANRWVVSFWVLVQWLEVEFQAVSLVTRNKSLYLSDRPGIFRQDFKQRLSMIGAPAPLGVIFKQMNDFDLAFLAFSTAAFAFSHFNTRFLALFRSTLVGWKCWKTRTCPGVKSLSEDFRLCLNRRFLIANRLFRVFALRLPCTRTIKPCWMSSISRTAAGTSSLRWATEGDANLRPRDPFTWL